MRFHKELDGTYTLSDMNEDQVEKLYSILEFVSQNEDLICCRMHKEEYKFSKEISDLIGQFLDNEEYYQSINQ